MRREPPSAVSLQRALDELRGSAVKPNPAARSGKTSAPPRLIAGSPPRALARDMPRALAAARRLADGVIAELTRARRAVGLPDDGAIRFDHLCAVLNDGYVEVRGGRSVEVSSSELKHVFERSAPWPVLGWGNRRVALGATPDLVVKLPYTPTSEGDNRREADPWASAPVAVARHLAPVYAADPDGRWIVMQFADGIGCDDEEEDAYRAAFRVVTEAGLEDVSDAIQNWGTYDGRYVVRDYGTGPRSDAPPVRRAPRARGGAGA
jgi:hypothetical protein